MTIKPLLLQMLCWYALSISAYAHEITGDLSKVETFVELHALYHKVKASYPYIDSFSLKMSDDRPWIFSYYFDPAADSLFSCIGDPSATIARDDSAICNAPERAAKFSWSDAEVGYGKRNNLSPIDRHFHGPVYFLQGATPLSQFTTYVYYSGRGTVVKCRDTLTSYNFEFNKNGEHLFFQSEKKDEWTEHCEQLYLRS